MLADGESIAADFTPMWVGFSCLDGFIEIYIFHMEIRRSIAFRYGVNVVAERVVNTMRK